MTAAETWIETEIGRLHVEAGGPASGPAALLWPSLFTSCDTCWGPQTDRLHALGWRTVAVDPPGAGGSGGAPGPFTMRQCALAAIAVLDHLGIERALFMGVSWGGFVGLHAALIAPGRVSGLVLSNTSARRPSLAAKLRDTAVAGMIGTGFPGSLGKAVTSAMLSRQSLAADPAFAAHMRDEIDRLDKKALALTAKCVLAEREDISDDIHRIEVPALVVAGASDTALPPGHSEQIAARIRGARLITIAGVGHIATREAAPEFTDLLVDFLTRWPPELTLSKRTAENREASCFSAASGADLLRDRISSAGAGNP